MVYGYSPNSRRSASGSLLAGWLERLRPHPDTFVCGVRWPDGDGGDAQTRWRYRRVWVDPLRDGGIVSLRYGDTETLQVRLDADPWWDGGGPSARPALDVLSGRTADPRSGAAADPTVRVLLAVPPGELIRFGIAGL